jgi:D-alanine-D-alanine ligase
MKRMRTLVVMHSTLVPPDSLEGHSPKDIEEWRTEFDVVSTLKKAGHEVRHHRVEARDRLQPAGGVRRHRHL